jgi:hypothetical protein
MGGGVRVAIASVLPPQSFWVTPTHALGYCCSHLTEACSRT